MLSPACWCPSCAEQDLSSLDLGEVIPKEHFQEVLGAIPGWVVREGWRAAGPRGPQGRECSLLCPALTPLQT